MQTLSTLKFSNQLLPSDIAGVSELHRKIYTTEYGYGESFMEYVDTTLDEFYSRYDPLKDKVWLCKSEEELLGFLLLLHHDDQLVQLRYFVLSPQLRGRGIGNKWMNEFLDCMRERNYTRAFLYTSSELPAAAHLYKKAGFVLTESIPSERFGKPVVEQRYELVSELSLKL
ncbi:GNAT family N-acetyltransferase [Pollutibacter soli]|uniref:GNAT family N-acetyltransferase n=1 Tax=Pollutibacter soli TaxID=3034157 RepID=UPI0030132A0F